MRPTENEKLALRERQRPPEAAIRIAFARLELAGKDLEVADDLYPDACELTVSLASVSMAAQALLATLDPQGPLEQREAARALLDKLSECEAAAKASAASANRAFEHAMARGSEALQGYAAARLRFLVWAEQLSPDAQTAAMFSLAWMDSAAQRLVGPYDDPGLDLPWKRVPKRFDLEEGCHGSFSAGKEAMV